MTVNLPRKLERNIAVPLFAWMVCLCVTATAGVPAGLREKIPVGHDLLIAAVDSDRDLLDDDQEAALGTNPLDPDSDDDGYLDGEEVESGTDPLDGEDFPDLLSGAQETLSGPMFSVLDTAAPVTGSLEQTIFGAAFSVLKTAPPPAAEGAQTVFGPSISVLNIAAPPLAAGETTIFGPAVSVLNTAPPPLAAGETTIFGPVVSVLNTAPPPLAAAEQVLVGALFSVLNQAAPPDYTAAQAFTYGIYHLLNGYPDWLVRIYAVPREKTVQTGETFSLSIRAHPAEWAVSRAKMQAVFDELLLEVEGGAAGVVPSATFSVVNVKQVSANEILLDVGATGGTTSGGECEIATVTLRAKDTLSTIKTRFDIRRDGSTLLNESADNVLGWSEGSRVTISSIVEPTPTPTPGWVWRKPDVLFIFSTLWGTDATPGHPLDLLPDAALNEGDLSRLMWHWRSGVWPEPTPLMLPDEAGGVASTPVFR